MKKLTVEVEKRSYSSEEAVRTLRTNIQFCGDDKQVIVITSALPGEGKTNTAIQLAHAFGELDKTVLLIDADMRKSVMAARMKVEKVEWGLSHFLSGQCALSETINSINGSRLHVLLAGPLVPNPTELLSTERFKAMLESLRKVYDYVIIDSPPLGVVVDGAIVAKEADGAVIVLEAAKTKYRLARRIKSSLENTGCPILGAVLNRVDHRKHRRYYEGYYGKYYGKSRYGKYGEYYAYAAESTQGKLE